MADLTGEYAYNINYGVTPNGERVTVYMDIGAHDLERPDVIEHITKGIAAQLHKVLDMRLVADD